MSRSALSFAAILAVAAVVSWSVPGAQGLFYWLGALLIAAATAYFTGAARRDGSPLIAFGDDFLCDSCKYNHASTCSRPERPNAERCDDYKRRGTGG